MIFIHKCHMLYLPWAPLQQSVRCWLKPSTVVSRRLLSGRHLHINSFMSVCLCAHTVYLNLAYFLPLLLFFYIFRTPIKNGWELYLVQGNSLCQSTVGLEWMKCVCARECVSVWLGYSCAGGGDETSGCGVTAGLNQSTVRSARVQRHRG